jgi:hypothetical protein
MKHLFSTKLRVVLVIALLLAVGLTVLSNLTGLTVGEMMVQGVLTPLRTAASKLTDQAEQLFSYMFRVMLRITADMSHQNICSLYF